MTHDEARTEVQAIYDQTTASVGEGWDRPEGEWGVCTLPDRSEGDQWHTFNQRFQSLDGSPAEVAARVQSLWARLGYEVEIVQDDDMTPPRHVLSFPPYLTGLAPDGFGISLTVGDGYADFMGDGRCIVGDLTHY